MNPLSPKRSKTHWILLGCGALAVLIIICAFIAVISEEISPTTPTPSQIARPTPTQPPTATPIPEPTATPAQFVTVDGYDPASDSIIDPINLWIDYNDRNAGIAAQLHHGDRAKLIQRQGDGVLIETEDGTQGWLTYWFIQEFKDEYQE